MSLPDRRALSVLTLAGSDSGGGAGVQADLKTFAAHGLHGLSAFAALTAQNTRGVTAVHVPPTDFLRAQIDACFDDFRIGAVKLGMLANRQVIDAVADALERHQPDFIVLDPVMVATSGALARAGCPRCAAFTLARALDESRPSRRLLPRSRS
jgi:hydroxymethylpyrimidine/phosphomethylpyrimidine kinase